MSCTKEHAVQRRGSTVRRVNTTGHPYGTRAYYRVIKQRERDRKLAARMQGSAVCQWTPGHGKVCGAKLVDHIDRLGRVRWSCPQCARRRAGLCRTCPRPRQPGTTGIYCEVCYKARERLVKRARQRRDADLIAARRRAKRRALGAKPRVDLSRLTPEERLARARQMNRERKRRRRQQLQQEVARAV